LLKNGLFLIGSFIRINRLVNGSLLINCVYRTASCAATVWQFPSVCTHYKTRQYINRFWSNLIATKVTKNCRDITVFVYIEVSYRPLYMRFCMNFDRISKNINRGGKRLLGNIEKRMKRAFQHIFLKTSNAIHWTAKRGHRLRVSWNSGERCHASCHAELLEGTNVVRQTK